jgi:phytoene synthase
MRLFSPETGDIVIDPVDLAACRTLLCGGSRSFFAASLVLPQRVRDPATALYAFCRLADDAIDLHGASPQAVEQLHERLERAYQGRPPAIAADRAFAAVVHQFAIPRALPEALIEGFAWDAGGRRYANIGELYGYAARVAATVGAMMALLMGARDPAVVARACDLGVAMQLTNIARDVGEDAREGRLYLPLDWLAEAGIDADSWLAQPVYSEALGSVIQRLLHCADNLYRRAAAGVAGLPAGCRPGIHAARIIYAEIGRELERNGLDSVTRRAVVPTSRKLQLLGRALLQAALPQPPCSAPPLEQTRFLIDAVAAAPVPPDALIKGRLEDRIAWLVDLFERLERREQRQRAAVPAIPRSGHVASAIRGEI